MWKQIIETPGYQALLSGADSDTEPLMKRYLFGTYLHGRKPVKNTSARIYKKHTYGRHLHLITSIWNIAEWKITWVENSCTEHTCVITNT